MTDDEHRVFGTPLGAALITGAMAGAMSECAFINASASESRLWLAYAYVEFVLYLSGPALAQRSGKLLPQAYACAAIIWIPFFAIDEHLRSGDANYPNLAMMLGEMATGILTGIFLSVLHGSRSSLIACIPLGIIAGGISFFISILPLDNPDFANNLSEREQVVIIAFANILRDVALVVLPTIWIERSLRMERAATSPVLPPA